ncbi:hypothetical protein [Neobacillus terrae]|uniref:hypothetical protein n=1 Tax=Neobacillus terrae TaxID=3034837 RepID=UPI00140A976A|nr:hypothetical protein [Neobacillus terrae]NHM29669.1 hypothetical protein [Neobacillus terrae]
MKRKLTGFIAMILLLSIFAGCQRDMPKPRAKASMVKASEKKPDNSSLSQRMDAGKKDFSVHYDIRGKNLLIECMVNGVSFRQNDPTQKKLGKIAVWVDGKKKEEVASAAFIVRNLSPGAHRIKLDILNLKNKPYGMSRDFLVNIPN